jgi:hypothetical protein
MLGSCTLPWLPGWSANIELWTACSLLILATGQVAQLSVLSCSDISLERLALDWLVGKLLFTASTMHGIVLGLSAGRGFVAAHRW